VGVAYSSVVPTKVTDQSESETCVLRTAGVERLIGERFDSPCRRFRVFRALRFQADLLELNAKPYPRVAASPPTDA
jgi:hypothetical protein